jgi:hypothetical protein
MMIKRQPDKITVQRMNGFKLPLDSLPLLSQPMYLVPLVAADSLQQNDLTFDPDLSISSLKRITILNKTGTLFNFLI